MKILSGILSLYVILLSVTPCLESQDIKNGIEMSCCIEYFNDTNDSNSTNQPIEKGCMDCSSLLSCISSYTIVTPLIEYTLFSLEDTLLPPNDYPFVFNTSLISSSIWQPPKNSFFNPELLS